jgi:hypothetical protein
MENICLQFTSSHLLHGGVEGEGVMVRNTVPDLGCTSMEVIYPGQAVGITVPAPYDMVPFYIMYALCN